MPVAGDCWPSPSECSAESKGTWKTKTRRRGPTFATKIQNFEEERKEGREVLWALGRSSCIVCISTTDGSLLRCWDQSPFYRPRQGGKPYCPTPKRERRLTHATAKQKNASSSVHSCVPDTKKGEMRTDTRNTDSSLPTVGVRHISCGLFLPSRTRLPRIVRRGSLHINPDLLPCRRR